MVNDRPTKSRIGPAPDLFDLADGRLEPVAIQLAIDARPHMDAVVVVFFVEGAEIQMDGRAVWRCSSSRRGILSLLAPSVWPGMNFPPPWAAYQ